MCVLCLAKTTYHTECPIETLQNAGVTVFGDGLEGTALDFSQELSANAATAGRISVGGTATSQIETSGDRDWFRITLEAGETYQFDLEGFGINEISDPFLRLYKDGNLVAFNDDGGFFLDSRIEFTATTGGTYYLEAAGYSTATGEYRLSAAEVAPPPPPVPGGSILPSIDWGSRVDANRIDVYFAKDGETFNGGTSAGWTTYEIEKAMEALSVIESMIGISFRRVGSPTNAEFKLVVQDTTGGLQGSMVPPGEFGEGVGTFSRGADGWDMFKGGGLEPGGAGFRLLLHEFGHGLGLSHPHDTGGSSSVLRGVTSSRGDYGDFGLNQAVYSVMSYNGAYDSVTGTAPNYRYGFTETLSPLDIAVLQSKYGANEEANSGATSYVLADSNARGTAFAAIWDTSGKDWLKYNGERNATLDLRAASLIYEEGGGGFVSRASGIFGGYTIANGVVIENARGGSGNDRINGNGVGNTLQGREGNDRLSGYFGDDFLNGGAGADRLFGGSGTDTAVYQTAVTADLTNASANTGEAAGDTYSSIENLTGSDGNDRLRGDTNANALVGGDGDDILHGRLGDDALTGGAGADVLNGGSGTDTAIYQSAIAADLADASLNTGDAEGDEYTSIENLTGSTQADTLAGNQLGNVLDGNAGHDVLIGRAGNDTLLGGGGNDILNGGSGADVLNGGSGRDTAVYDTAVTANLTDRVLNEGAALGDQYISIENLTGSDSRDILIGNSRGNVLSGNGGDDFLSGRGGADTLVGGEGADTLDGGFGRDTVAYNSSVLADLGNPHLNTGEADGDVYASIENLSGSTANDNLRGTDLANALIGDDGNDVLFGRGGDDNLIGGVGRDRLDGGEGDDFLLGGSGNDRFVFAGGDGVDTIGDYETGTDTLRFVGTGQGFSDLAIVDGDEGAVIDYGDGTVTLNNVAASSLLEADFEFV
jgi:serralysin